MSGSVHVITRSAKDTRYPRRFIVRYRRGGRYFKVEHAGSFKTSREATERRNLVGGWLAQGLDPRQELANLAGTATPKTLATWAEEWLASRLDAAPKTVETYRHALACFERSEIGAHDALTLTPADIAGWVTENAQLSPATLRLYRTALRQVLDFAGLEESNPARHRSVKLPALARIEVEPPSAADFLALLTHVPAALRLPLVLLEQTGLRIGEAVALEWRDVDVADCRLRVRGGKTRSARRWAQVPEWLMRVVAATCAPEDRVPERRVFHVSEDRLQAVMRRACTAAGIASFTPHSLRHRRLSLWHGQGVPARVLAERAGHSRASMSLDVYSHVMPLDEVAEEAVRAAVVMHR